MTGRGEGAAMQHAASRDRDMAGRPASEHRSGRVRLMHGWQPAYCLHSE